MATGIQTLWNGNGQSTAQVTTATVTAVPGAGGGTLTATINAKSITYTTLATDTTSTAAASWATLLQAAAALLGEFGEATWTANSNVLSMTVNTPGTPITVTFTAASGATITQATQTANSSPSDVSNANNWLRGGFENGTPSLPQALDDVVVNNSATPLLWNLDFFATTPFNSYTRWQNFSATVGLPEINPNGYVEYRPTYFQFLGPPGGTLPMLLGQGSVGTGPTRERYNVGSQQTAFNVLATGNAQDAYAVRLLGSNPLNTLRQVATSVGIAMLTGEQAALALAVVDSGGTLDLGQGVSFGGSSSSGASGSSSQANAGSIICINGTLNLYTAPALVTLDQGAVLNAFTSGLSFPQVIASGASTINWLCNSNIGNLLLQNASVFSKSGDVQAMSIAASTMDANCFIRDPNNAITFLAPTVVNGAVTFGPITFGRGKRIQVLT